MKYHILLSVFLFSISGTAQKQAASQFLQKIFDELPLDCQTSLIENNECDCSIKGVGFHLKCESIDNKIANLRITIFNDSFKNGINPFIYLFIETELLKFVLDDNKSRESRRIDDHVFIYYSNIYNKKQLFNNVELVSNVILDLNEISIIEDSLNYKAILTNNNSERIELEFPKNNGLIRGLDKKELDDFIYSELVKNTQIKQKQSEVFNYNQVKKTDDLIVYQGENYLINDFSSDRYFKTVNDSFVLVFNKSHPKESFSNLFLTNISSIQDVNLALKIKNYSNIDMNINTTVNKFLSNFDKEYKLFFGIEDFANNQLKGSLILYNPQLNYIHLLNLETTNISIFGNPGYVSGILYTYIPTHNINDLFGKNDSELNDSMLIDDILKVSNDD